MDPNNLDRDFKLISKFNGVCLNIEEKTRLEIGLQELMISEKNESLKFWGIYIFVYLCLFGAIFRDNCIIIFIIRNI